MALNCIGLLKVGGAFVHLSSESINLRFCKIAKTDNKFVSYKFRFFMKFRMERIPSFTLLILYTLLLIKLVLFKGAYFFRIVPTNADYEFGSQTSALISYNLVPFKTIIFYIQSNVPLLEKLFNVFGNVLLFIPFGFFLSMVLTAARFWNILIISFMLSALFELFQFRTHTGTADIDDVILNTSGGILGYIILVNLKRLLDVKRSRVF